MRPVSRELWRALLRSARRYDHSPALRSLLASPRRLEFDLLAAAWIPTERLPLHALLSPEQLSLRVVERVVGLLAGGGRLYVPGRADGGTMVGALRRAMREAVSEADERLHTDAGFCLLRRLEAPIRIAERVLGPPVYARVADHRSVDRKGVLRLAPHDGTQALCRGSVLISHPLMRRDVVLLLEADGPDGYAFGVVTNAPTTSPFGAGPLTAPGHGIKAAAEWTTGRRQLRDELAPFRRTREADLEVFAGSIVFYGGPDGGWNLTMLHPHEGIRGSVQLRDGLYYGGDLAEAAALVRAGKASSADFCFYRGRVDWHPGALRGECAQGEWLVAEWVANAGAAWPPPGLMPRLARYAASAADLQLNESITDLGTGANGRVRSYKLGAWAHVVAAVADAQSSSETACPQEDVRANRGIDEPAARSIHRDEPDSSHSGRNGASIPGHPLRDWLRLHALEPSEVDTLQGAGSEIEARLAPPAWRTREDWGVWERWPREE